MTKDEWKVILDLHSKWLSGEVGGTRAVLTGAVLRGAVLTRADLTGAVLRDSDLTGADLTRAVLTGADLRGADFTRAVLTDAVLRDAVLTDAVLTGADLTRAVLTDAVLRGAVLTDAVLTGAVLRDAVLRDAVLTDAVLTGAKRIVKIMGVEPGNFYWKRFCFGLKNNGYQFYVGLNELLPGEKFDSDDRKTCSYPGFHFASRSWCDAHYPDRSLEAKIQIPIDAQINEPWATDGKASADKIIILQVFENGADVTDRYRRPL